MEIETVLVTGANRGIGLELVTQFLAHSVKPKAVFAACRSPDGAEDLRNLQRENPNLHIVKIDLGDWSTIRSAAQTVEEIVGSSGLNLIINNAGIAGRDTIGAIDAQQMMDMYKVNAVGPTMVVQEFLALLRRASVRRDDEMSIRKAAVVNVTSGVGSITENDAGGAYCYRCSKAALNMVTKNLSLDLKKDGILVTTIHPGWVQTGMGGAHASTTTSDCVKTLIGLIATFTDQSHHGKFYHYSGREMAW